MTRVRMFSTIAMVLMVPMLIVYPVNELSWLLDLAFMDPQRWTRNDAWVDPNAQIGMATRIVFFLVWLVPTVLGVSAYALGMWTLYLVRQGIVFDLRMARGVTWMGAMIVLSSAAALLAGAVSPMIRSWHNADGPLPLRFWYSTGNLGMLYCGMAFIFLGLVMREAIRLARENEEFV